jgi:capsular polysaccharide export protein
MTDFFNPERFFRFTSERTIFLGFPSSVKKNLIRKIGSDKRFSFTFLRTSSFRRAVSLAEENNACLIAWATEKPQNLLDLARQKGINVISSYYSPIASFGNANSNSTICFSKKGMYFDASSPNDLEDILCESKKKHKRDLIGEENIRSIGSNLEDSSNIDLVTPWPAAYGKKILIIGDNPSSSEAKFGSLVIKNDQDLLFSVRRNNPDASIIYKPNLNMIGCCTDNSVSDEDIHITDIRRANKKTCMASQILEADEVHVTTSNDGLNACFLGVPLVCYGQPHFSGWGFTKDIHPLPSDRRQKNISFNRFIYSIFNFYTHYL